MPMNFIAEEDPEVWAAIAAEIERQEDGLEMIASENYTSPAVMQAVGSVLTNKYAEGYPGRRYYGGCEHVDVVENLARDRAKKLFGAEHVNVQPHSGSQANMAVYLTAIEPGDTVLGLDLAHGGHLTHGMKLNISGKLYHFVSYGVTRDTHRIDFDQVAALAREHKPKLIVAGASAYPREIPHGKFAEIAKIGRGQAVCRHGPLRRPGGRRACTTTRCRWPISSPRPRTRRSAARAPASPCAASEYAKDLDRNVFPGIQGGPLMHVDRRQGDLLRRSPAAGVQDIRPARSSTTPRPWPKRLLSGGVRLISGGTDNHLMLVDVTPLGLAGKQAEAVLGACGITVNKNMIPYDERKPLDPSGIRLGTPALTTRGMGQHEMKVDRRLDLAGV